MDKCFDTRDGCRGKLAVGIRSGRTRRSNFHDLMVHHRIIFPRQNGGARTLRVETMSLCLRCQLRDKRGLLTAGRPRAPIAGANGGVTSLKARAGGPGFLWQCTGPSQSRHMSTSPRRPNQASRPAFMHRTTAQAHTNNATPLQRRREKVP